MADSILSLRGVTKSYGGNVVLDHVDIDFNASEVHALLGENGAGKSTMIKAITGAIEVDSGEIMVVGSPCPKMTPHLSSSLGIEAIYQEFNLVPMLSVSENVFLGSAIRKGVVIDRKEMARQTTEIFESFGLSINPDELVKNLSVAYMQLVEIAKSVSKHMKVLILDEPTAPLTDKETDVLFALMKQLKAQGVAIIFISHRMEELFMVADKVTVLRDGQKIITLDIQDCTRQKLVSYMVGRELVEAFPERPSISPEVVLEGKHIYGSGLKDINFQLHQSEVLGFGGLVGAGRTELVRILFGADRMDSGELYYRGEKVKITSPASAIRHRIALITEDRKTQGLVLAFSAKFNISLPILPRLSSGPVLRKKREQKVADDAIEKLSIKVFSREQLVSTLSGGNQQKVVIAKWLATEADIIILDEPTRGIDVGTKQEIYQLVNRLTEQGKSVILISSEMPELMGLSDRIIVLCEGQIAGEQMRSDFDQRKILDLAMFRGAEE